MHCEHAFRLTRPSSIPLALRRPFRAEFATGGASKEGRTGKPITVHFASNTCNLTGLQLRPAPNAPVGKVLSKFVSGKYVVNAS